MCESVVQELRQEYEFALCFYQALLEAGYAVSAPRLRRCDVTVWEIVSQKSDHRVQLRHEPSYALNHRFTLVAADREAREWREVSSLFEAARWYWEDDTRRLEPA